MLNARFIGAFKRNRGGANGHEEEDGSNNGCDQPDEGGVLVVKGDVEEGNGEEKAGWKSRVRRWKGTSAGGRADFHGDWGRGRDR